VADEELLRVRAGVVVTPLPCSHLGAGLVGVVVRVTDGYRRSVSVHLADVRWVKGKRSWVRVSELVPFEGPLSAEQAGKLADLAREEHVDSLDWRLDVQGVSGWWIDECYHVLVGHELQTGWPVNLRARPAGPEWAVELWENWPDRFFPPAAFVRICWAVKHGGDVPTEEAVAAFLTAMRLSGFFAGREVLVANGFRAA